MVRAARLGPHVRASAHEASLRYTARRNVLRVTLTALLLALPSGRAAALEACSATDLCAPSANPCTISGTVDVGEACHLDFGTRDVVLTGVLRAAAPGGSFSVSAGSLTLKAGKIRSVGPTATAGGNVTVTVTGAFRMNGSGPTLDVSGAAGGGFVGVEAGSIDIQSGSIEADGTGTEACGGVVSLRARSGPLLLAAPVHALGHALCAGGFLELSGQSVELRSPLNVTGGDFPGGVTVTADAGDLLLASTASIRANGEQIELGDGGDGGPIALLAESGNVTLLGPVETTGATPEGEGGSIVILAGGTLHVGGLLSAEGNGGESNGGTIEIDAPGGVTFEHHVRVNGGTGAAGGEIDVRSDGDVTLTALPTMQANGGFLSAGSITLRDARSIDVQGTIQARASSGGRGGFITLESCRATIAGTLDVSAGGGGPSGANAVTAGVIQVAATGRLFATPCDSSTPGTSCNVLTVSGGAPTIDPLAVLTPLAQVSVDPSYNACCGNGSLEPGEACDDGNGASCDGCSRFCQTEPSPPCPSDGNECTADCTPDAGCIYRPRTGEACSDDGDACTSDVCSATAQCRHVPRTCNDGIECTVDACVPGVGCVATPDDTRCDDDEACTADQCDPATGCVHDPEPDGTPCSDGSFCTTGDACLGGTCTPQGPPLVCDDGNACTIDECLPAIGCRNREDAALCACGGTVPEPDGTPCADGNDCTRGDVCLGGVCEPGPGCPDDGSACTQEACVPFPDGSELCLAFDDQCAMSCAGQPDGTPCSDGSACTEGTCQGGSCVTTPISCGDGDPCTGVDYCHPLLGCRSGAPPVDEPLCQGPPPALDVFTCYRAMTTRGTLRFAPIDDVGFADPWGAGLAHLRKPRSLCFPTDLGGADPEAPLHPDKLEGYMLRLTDVVPSAEPRSSIEVTNALGTLRLDLLRPDAALVPTAVDLDAPPAAPVPPGPGRFACYKVKATRGTPRFVPVTGVTVRDQLGTLTVQLRRPSRICAPLDLAGDDPGAPARDERLLCYQARVVSGTPRFARRSGLFASNAFGSERLDATQLAEVCVPSE